MRKAIIDQVPVSFVAFRLLQNRQVGEIWLNVVSPENQDRGLGVQVYKQIIALMRNKGAKVAQ